MARHRVREIGKNWGWPVTDNQTLLGIQEIIAIKNQFIFLTLKPPAAAKADWTIRHAGRYYQYEFCWRLFQSSVQHCFSRIADFHLPLPHQFFIICFPKKPLEAFEMGFKSYLKQFKCINLASNSLRTFFFFNIYLCLVWDNEDFDLPACFLFENFHLYHLFDYYLYFHC